MGVFVFWRERVTIRNQQLAFWASFAGAYALCAWYAASMGGSTAAMRLDEYTHFTQIELFRHGDFRVLSDALTTIPGYHFLIAVLLKIFGADSFSATRLINSLFGLPAVIAFYCLRRDTVGRDDWLATAQFAVLPIFMLFIFMVQTDVLALALMLWAFWAAGRQHHWLAGACVLAAMCVRQNYVFWIGLLAWPSVWTLWQQRSAAALVKCVREVLPYIVVGGVFVVYWIVNGSVSLSHAQTAMHPDFALHTGNLFYLMFVGMLLLPFACMASWRQFIADVRSRPWRILVPLVLATLYLGTFKVDHPYNLLQPPDLRDALLIRTRESALWYCGFGLVAVFGGIGLLWQKLLTKDAVAFWVVTALFLSLHWLIEQRYYLLPVSLLLAWRVPQSVTVERATLALWAPLAVLLFWGMMTGNLYL
jgi:alpha-1,2-glucosyltransferase